MRPRTYTFCKADDLAEPVVTHNSMFGFVMHTNLLFNADTISRIIDVATLQYRIKVLFRPDIPIVLM
jgi:hypothetical protein